MTARRSMLYWSDEVTKPGPFEFAYATAYELEMGATEAARKWNERNREWIDHRLETGKREVLLSKVAFWDQVDAVREKRCPWKKVRWG